MKTSDQIRFMEVNRCYPFGGRMNLTAVTSSIRVFRKLRKMHIPFCFRLN